MIVGTELLKLITKTHGRLIWNHDQNAIRHVSYDMTVGRIMLPEGGDAGREPCDDDGSFSRVSLVPQGLAVIESAECVHVPPDMVAIAHPKTKLCEDGLLILNTGIVDPRYEGTLTGTAVNFSKVPIPLKKGDPFLRLTFHPISEESKCPVGNRPKDHLRLRYPHEFMDVTKVVQRAILKAVVIYSSIALAVLSFILAVVPVFVERVWPASRIDDLERELERLERRMEQNGGAAIREQRGSQ